MNSKQYFGVSGQFSLVKLLNVVVILSMLLASCGNLEKQTPTTTPIESVTSEKTPEQNDYEPPVYTHPEPVMGERPTNQSVSVDKPAPIQESSTQESEQNAEPSINETEVSGTSGTQVTQKSTSSVKPGNNPKQKTNTALQGNAATGAIERDSFDALSCASWPAAGTCEVIEPGKHLRFTYSGGTCGWFCFYVYVSLPYMTWALWQPKKEDGLKVYRIFQRIL